jgi:hypothetical protein
VQHEALRVANSLNEHCGLILYVLFVFLRLLCTCYTTRNEQAFHRSTGLYGSSPLTGQHQATKPGSCGQPGRLAVWDQFANGGLRVAQNTSTPEAGYCPNSSWMQEDSQLPSQAANCCHMAHSSHNSCNRNLEINIGRRNATRQVQGRGDRQVVDSNAAS